MPYWAVVRLEPQRERLALHCLGLAGYETYFPRLREKRISHGRKIEVRPPLFPGYAFVAIELQWHTARWSAGVIGLIMDGFRPAKVADSVIADIRSRERGGLVELPRREGFKAGEQVRVLAGPFEGHLGLYAACARTNGCWCCWRCWVDSSGSNCRRTASRPCAPKPWFASTPCWRSSSFAAQNGQSISVAPSVTIRPLMLILAQRVSHI